MSPSHNVIQAYKSLGQFIVVKQIEIEKKIKNAMVGCFGKQIFVLMQDLLSMLGTQIKKVDSEKNSACHQKQKKIDDDDDDGTNIAHAVLYETNNDWGLLKNDLKT